MQHCVIIISHTWVLVQHGERVAPRATASVHRMHPRNPLHGRLDFDILASRQPGLARFVHDDPRYHRPDGSPARTLAWREAGCVPALTSALLGELYHLSWSLPAGHLCPPLPNRLNYLLFVDDLIQGVLCARDWMPSISGATRTAREARLVDIGTGASAVLALLGYAHFGWRMLATDVELESLKHAQALMNLNCIPKEWVRLIRVQKWGFAPRGAAASTTSSAAEWVTATDGVSQLEVLRTDEVVNAAVDAHAPPSVTAHAATAAGVAPVHRTDASAGVYVCAREGVDVAALLRDDQSRFVCTCCRLPQAVDAVVCNPPFYSVHRDSHTGVGTLSEMVTAGGEVAFVQQMMDESIAAHHTPAGAAARTPCVWYTSMLGHTHSVGRLLEYGRRNAEAGMHMRVGALVQGRTHRHAVAWTLSPMCSHITEGWAVNACATHSPIHDRARAISRAAAVPSESTEAPAVPTHAGAKRSRAEMLEPEDEVVEPGEHTHAAALTSTRRNVRFFHMLAREGVEEHGLTGGFGDMTSAQRHVYSPSQADVLALCEEVHTATSLSSAVASYTHGESALSSLPTVAEVCERVASALTTLDSSAHPTTGISWRVPHPLLALFASDDAGVGAHVHSEGSSHCVCARISPCIARVFRGCVWNAAGVCTCRFEVHIAALLPAPTVKRARASSAVPLCIAIAAIACNDRAAFGRLADRIQRDTVRTGRMWRRRAAREDATASDAAGDGEMSVDGAADDCV